VQIFRVIDFDLTEAAVPRVLEVLRGHRPLPVVRRRRRLRADRASHNCGRARQAQAIEHWSEHLITFIAAGFGVARCYLGSDPMPSGTYYQRQMEIARSEGFVEFAFEFLLFRLRFLH
jgi:hypothetical protein